MTPVPAVAILEAAKPTRERCIAMSTDEKILEQVELHVNALAAEITVQKIILQVFVAHLASAFPQFSEEVLHNLKRESMTILERQPINPQDDPEGQQRSKALSIAHGERFFRELEAALSAARNRAGQSGRN
jgi:hypothetical protein